VKSEGVIGLWSRARRDCEIRSLFKMVVLEPGWLPIQYMSNAKAKRFQRGEYFIVIAGCPGNTRGGSIESVHSTWPFSLAD